MEFDFFTQILQLQLPIFHMWYDKFRWYHQDKI
jgi:hypothetical protein